MPKYRLSWQVTFTVGKNKKKYNVLPEQSVHGVNIVRTSIWTKMSYEEKLEYEYCMALKQKLSMNNKAYAACYGLINSIPFVPEMNNLTYSLLMDKKDPKVYADSPEGRLKNADIQSDGWCTKGEVIGDIAQVVVPFAWAKLSKAGECVKVVEVASEGEKSVALAEKGIGAASKVEKTAKVTSEVDEAASSNVGGKFGESISALKATKSESEIAELEKTKVKEVKPKDVEVEKPKVSKVEEKPIGPQAKLEKVKFKEGRYEHHMSYVEKFTKKGVSGGHNWKKFDDYIGKSEYSFDYHKVIKHPDIDGVYDIKYTFKRPIKDYTGKTIPGEFKHVPRENRIFKETVYDPNVISDNEMIKLSKDAMKEAVKSGRGIDRSRQNKFIYQGEVSYKGKKIKFEGYYNKKLEKLKMRIQY